MHTHFDSTRNTGLENTMNGTNLLKNRLARAGLMLAAAVATFSGCAADIGDISRIQPDLYPKSHFTGTWYMRGTVIRTQYHQGLAFEGGEGELDKIRWEIQQDHLVAFRAYEAIPNAEQNPGSHTPVAMFRILTHADVRRDYNPVNGQETNVLVENTMDRPWHEREYIRVDWSRNVKPDYFIAGMWRLDVAETQAINQMGDKYEPEQPRIGADYMEVVTRHWMVTDSWFGYMYAGEYSDLGSIVDVRWSFKKVEDRGYEQLLYPDFLPVKVRYRYARRLSANEFEPCTPAADDPACVPFGGAPSSGPAESCPSASDTPTAGWNGTALCALDTTPELDCFCTGAPTELLVNGNGNICDSRLGADPDPEDCEPIVYPIFEKFGYFRTLRMPFDWERGFTFNGRIYLANRWHIWERSKNPDGTLIPEAERTPKPIVYYTNPEFPEDLWEDAQHIATDWSKPLEDVVATLKNVPENATPDQRAAVVPQMYQVVRNSCTVANVKAFARDHGLEDVLNAAVGGVERVEMGNVKRACTALEVETRTKPAGERFDWQRVGDIRYAFMHWVHTPQQAGPLGYGPSSVDPETGEIVSANAYIYGAAVDTYANFAADMVQLLNGEVSPTDFIEGDNVVAEITTGRAVVNEGLSRRSARQMMERFDQLDSRLGERHYMPQLPSARELAQSQVGSAAYKQDQNNRLALMKNFAAQHLTTDDMLRAFAGPDGFQPGQLPTDNAMQAANPTNWGRYPDGLARTASVDGRATTDNAQGVLNSQARFERLMAEKNIEYGNMIAEPAVYHLAQKLKGKAREEVVRYARKKIFYGIEAHEVGHTLGLRHNFAGSSDAMNFHPEFWNTRTAEDPQDQWDFAYSSIMDYHQRFNSDWAGVGPYDRAAIKFGYGQLMEAFDERAGAFIPRDYFSFATSVLDYKDLPRIVSGTNVDEIFEAAYYDGISGRTSGVELPASVPANVDNLVNKRRNVRFADVWQDYNRDVLPSFIDGVYSPEYENQFVTVPYQFCSDMYAWGGNLTCNRYDMGANIQEIVKHAREMYEGYYLFNNFRRDRYAFLGGPMSFNVSSYLTRLYDRTFQPMLNAYRYFFYYRRSLLMIYPLVQDWAAAALDGINFFGGVLQSPEPGRYCQQFGRYERGSCPAGSSESTIQIPVGQGRYFGTRWSDEYYYKPMRIGSYWDKWMALQALTDSQFFLVRDFSSLFDRGAFSITYYRVFEKEMTDLFRNLLTGDLGQYSAGVRQDPATGQWMVIPKALVGTDTQGAPSLPAIRATSNWNLQKLSSFFAALGFTSSVDRKMDFSRRMRITYLGAADDPEYEGFQAAEIIQFEDPVTHLTYRAAPVGGLDAPGYQLVQEAKTFHDTSWVTANNALTAAKANLEAVRADMNSTAEQLNAAIAARDEADAEFTDVDRLLREKIELMEYVRILGFYMHLYAD